MHWMIILIGLAVILLAARAGIGSTRRSDPAPIPFTTTEERIREAAKLGSPHGRRRLRASVRMLRTLEGAIRQLNRTPGIDRLPAAKWLCENGRFLQSEAASAIAAARSIRPLPCAGSQARVYLFACEAAACSNSALDRQSIKSAADIWQRESPMTTDELDALPTALQLALLSSICRMAQRCAQDQRAAAIAEKAAKHLLANRMMRASRLVRRHHHSPAFTERLLACTDASIEATQTLEKLYPPGQLWNDERVEEEHLRQSELCLRIGNSIAALRAISRIPWHRFTEEISTQHALLKADSIYCSMDDESRAYYRRCASNIARRCRRSERSVCAAALELCRSANADNVKAHTGYYLADDGLAALLKHMQAFTPQLRLQLWGKRHACSIFRVFSWSAFLGLALLAWCVGMSWPAILPFAALFTHTAQQAAVRMLQRFVPVSITPRIRLTRLSAGERTLVVCPAMLQSADHALAMVKRMSIMHEANAEKELHFLLLGDFQDSLTGTLASDEEIMHTALSAAEALAADTGHPFFYMQRERVCMQGDSGHHSRERKRGAVETVLKLLQGESIEDTFACSTIDPAALKGLYRYVIVLDSDTILPPGSAIRLVGAMLHPLQRRQQTDGHMRGASILQPRMETAAHTVLTAFGRITGGAGGTAAYNLPGSNFDQDILGRGTFMGKGIIDPEPFLSETHDAIPSMTILSHDLLEGELTGCGYCSDIVLYDGQPQTLRAMLKRLHRWTRGDWQLLPYLLPFSQYRKQLDATGRFKLWRNLLGSVISPMRLILLIYAAASQRALLFACVLLLPELLWMARPLSSALAGALLRIAMLPCEAVMQADAIGRALYRLFISRQHLLQWVTADQLAQAEAKPPMLFFYISMGAAALMGALGFWRISMRLPALVPAVLWAMFPFALPALEQSIDRRQQVTPFMRDVLVRLARSTLTFFETTMTGADHGLIPDNVQIEPNRGIAHRTSPTNIGLYLCALLSAEKLRLLSANEAARRMAETVSSLEKLPKWHGLPYNWYDTQTLSPLPPAFVSSVDCGNLAVCLLTSAQGIRTLLSQLDEVYHDLPARMDQLAQDMAFERLYDAEAELFFIGWDTEKNHPAPSHYDLLASESRLLSYTAIMLRRVPIKHWFRLGRPHCGPVLLSYSGTMFEYLMPLLFQPLTSGTLLSKACKAALKAQKKHALSGAFGVSESGYYAFDPDLNYQYKAFGTAALALSADASGKVLAPYASLLSLTLDAKGAFRNLQRLKALGLEGPLGMFEAADLDPIRTDGQSVRIIRSHMAHHQGMIMLAICNVLEHGYIAHLFSSLPRAEAYRLLLEEFPYSSHSLIRKQIPSAVEPSPPPSCLMVRAANPLCFPIDAHVLSGGGTTLVVDAQGGGFMHHHGVMLTRLREGVYPPGGILIYLRDSQSGVFWSATDPYISTQVQFETAQALFCHTHMDVHCETRIWVDPLSGTAVHCVALENLRNVERTMEACSYIEPALGPQTDDRAHPAFRNLFVQMHRLGRQGVKAVRRSGDPNATQCTLWHTLSCDQPFAMFRIQCDRSAFLGRGQSIYAPRALHYPISAVADSLGDVIEPCVSLRGQFTLPPRGRITLVFATRMAQEEAEEGTFCQRYGNIPSALRTYDAALTRGLAAARHIGADCALQQTASRLAGALLFTGQPHQSLHTAANALPRSRLWTFGISGDVPVMLLEYAGRKQREVLEQLLTIHAFYRLHGVECDLVIVTGTKHLQEVQECIYHSHSRNTAGQKGGVHVLCDAQEADRALLRALARVVLHAGKGSIDEQLDGLKESMDERYAYAYRKPEQRQAALPPVPQVLMDNGFGGFTPAEGNYQITLPPGRHTPAPWCNPLCSSTFGTLASESGLVFSYVKNSYSGRLNRWPSDAIAPQGEEMFFVRDEQQHLIWSVTRHPLGHGMPVRITHAPGETTYESSFAGVYARMQCFTDLSAPIGARVITLRNETAQGRILTLHHCCSFAFGAQSEEWQLTNAQIVEGGIRVHAPQLEGAVMMCAVDGGEHECSVMSAGEFHGLWGTVPYALGHNQPSRRICGDTGILSWRITLSPGESCTVTSALVYSMDEESCMQILHALRQDGASSRLHRVRLYWEEKLGVLRFDLPCRSLSLMLGRWLPYQVQASRLWMRAGFYQAGGAIGFRDQLQDMLSLLLTEPEQVREHILECSHHQFEEGDVQHWWHPPMYGVRTRISDDKLFLPYVCAAYVQATDDRSVLEIEIPYLRAPLLETGEDSRLSTPEVSAVTETLREHCLRAIQSVRTGAHGLPLMMGGDWNDGMDQVGGENGESVWLGMFLCEVLRTFAPLCSEETEKRLLHQRKELLDALDRYAWDGAWYLRGWYHSGARLGGNDSSECRIDLIAQAWAALCGVDRIRAAQAMENACCLLTQSDTGIVRLFTPAFNGKEHPGYIAGYLPGVRENGGQYTHAVCWAVWALHTLGEGERAWAMAQAMLPTAHAATRQLAARYRVEPYAMAADIYANPQQRGRGGWTWYTGSAGWYLHVIVTKLLGLRREGDRLLFQPIAPKKWDSLTITYRFGSSTYHLHAQRGCVIPIADGKALSGGALLLQDDGRIHEATFPLR